MKRDHLYQLSFEFKKTKLWKKLQSILLFAVQFSNGTIGYCSVSGEHDGEDTGLSIYFENGLYDLYQCVNENWISCPWLKFEHYMRRSALACMFRCKDEMPPDNVSEMQAYCKANNIRLSGANACPSFERITPYRLPWYIGEKDEIMLAEALEAALEVAEKLKNVRPEKIGFVNSWMAGVKIPLLVKKDNAFVWKTCVTPTVSAPKLPSPRVKDELLIARLRKQKRTSAVWNCAMIMHPQPLTTERLPVGAAITAPPMFPMVFLVQDNETGEIVSSHMDHMYPASAPDFCCVLLNLMLEHGRPASINAIDERVLLLVEKAAAQVSVTVQLDANNPVAHHMLMDYYGHFAGLHADDFGEDVLSADEFDELDMMLDQISLDDMPDDALKQLMHALVEKPMSPSVTQKVFDEWFARFVD